MACWVRGQASRAVRQANSSRKAKRGSWRARYGAVSTDVAEAIDVMAMQHSRLTKLGSSSGLGGISFVEYIDGNECAMVCDRLQDIEIVRAIRAGNSHVGFSVAEAKLCVVFVGQRNSLVTWMFYL